MVSWRSLCLLIILFCSFVFSRESRSSVHDACAEKRILPYLRSIHDRTDQMVDRNSVWAQPDICESKVLYSAYQLLHEDRFDLLPKLLFIRLLHANKCEDFFQVPTVGISTYLKHEEVWNNFRGEWKRNKQDFMVAFQDTYLSIKTFGFSNAHPVPVVHKKEGKELWISDGAHRSAISIALGLENVPIHCEKKKKTRKWDWQYFHRRGFPGALIDLSVYHFLLHSENVFMLNIWPQGTPAIDKLNTSLSTVIDILRVEGGKVVYWKEVWLNLNAHAMFVHMAYGNVKWLHQQQQRTFEANYPMFCVFAIFQNQKQAYSSWKKVRAHLFRKSIGYKQTAHMTSGHGDLLLLARQLLFANSLHYMNHSSGQGKESCYEASKYLASIPSLSAQVTTQGMPLHNEFFSVDTGSVMGFYGLRIGTDFDLVFNSHLHSRECKIVSNKILSHADDTVWFSFHNASVEDILYNPENVGYCYGLKFVSLGAVLSYKRRRYEVPKDREDIRRIVRFLQMK